MNKSLLFLFLISVASCGSSQEQIDSYANAYRIDQNEYIDKSAKVIHILVALCDNEHQGIVPVPNKIGNGQDPHNNLYWGAAYGVKTFFKRSADWELLKSGKHNDIVLERVVFKHKQKDYYMVADAYDGRYIKETTIDFLESTSGQQKEVLEIDGRSIGLRGNAQLIAYIGHDGLMDFTLNRNFNNSDGQERDAIILACHSKSYFTEYLEQAKANPVLWTTGLMAPEAYTIHDALSEYIDGGTDEEISKAGARAYAKYQKCGVSAASRLLVNN